MEGEQSDWWNAYDISGFVGILAIRRGEMLIEGEGPTRYIQMILDDRRSSVIADDFQNDADMCGEIEEQLARGVVDWYGRLLTLRRCDGDTLSDQEL